MNNSKIIKHFVAFATVFSLMACGSSNDENTPENNAPVITLESPAPVIEGEQVSFSVQATDPEGDYIEYNWTNLDSSHNISFVNASTSTVTFIAPDIDEQKSVTLKVTATDKQGASTSEEVEFIVDPIVLSATFPEVIGQGCAVPLSVSANVEREFSYTWELTLSDGVVILDGDQSDEHITVNSTTDYTLNIIASFEHDVYASYTQGFTAQKSLPLEMWGGEFVIDEDTTVIVCNDTTIYNGEIIAKPGAKIKGINDQPSTLEMGGKFTAEGTESKPVYIENINMTPINSGNGKAGRVDITNTIVRANSSIVLPEGSIQATNSIFNGHHSQDADGNLLNNTFNDGVTLSNNKGVYAFNSITCGQTKPCVSFKSYGFLNYPRPVIEQNNFFNIVGHNVTYSNWASIHADIDIKNNYWAVDDLTQLSEIIIDANNDEDKSYVFLYDPAQLEANAKAYTAPVATITEVDGPFLADEAITLTGEQSTSSLYNQHTYRWAFHAYPKYSKVKFDDDEAETASFTPDLPGEYIVSLMINDGAMDSEVSTFTINVTQPPKLELMSYDHWGSKTETPLPFNRVKRVTGRITSTPPPTSYRIARFELTALASNFTIINVKAEDETNTVEPYFDGLQEGMVITQDTTVEFRLRSPLTEGKETNLIFSFEVAETGETFYFEVALTTN